MSDCRAVLSLKGEHYPCEVDHTTSSGLAHANKELGATWCSDGEAKRYGKKPLPEREK